MFNKLKMLALLILTFNLVACGGASEGTPNNDTGSKPGIGGNEVATPYTGTYKGEFTGIETGSWEITINPNGGVMGNATTTTLPITTYPLTGTINTAGNSTLISGNSNSDITFKISIISGIVTGNWSSSAGGGAVSGIVISTGAVSGVLSVSGDFGNKSFTPLNVNKLSVGPVYLIAFDNLPGGQIQTDPGFDDHLITLYFDPITNNLVAVGYSFLNPASLGVNQVGYIYQRDCLNSPCPSISVNLAQNTVTFTNTELRVDSSALGDNVAIMSATVNGTLTWN
jgi:hypothetical protein